MNKQALLFILVGLLAGVLGFLTLTPYQAILLVSFAGYWFMLLLSVLLVVFAWRSWGRQVKWREWVRIHATGLAVALAAAAFLHCQEEHGFKVMADEAVITATSMQMHFSRESTMAVRAYGIGDDFFVMASHLDKRPLFFPFLVSVLHDFTGYRSTNAIWLNAFLSLVFTVLTYFVGRRLAGFWGGVLGVILLVGVPLMHQNATGAGFDFLNVIMILLTMLLGMRLLEAPDENRLSVFVVGAALLMQVRYESALFVLPAAATVVCAWLRANRLLLPPTVLASPLFLLLIPLQHNVFNISRDAWQLNGIKDATEPFGIGYFYDNVAHAMNFVLSLDGSQGNSWLLGVAGTLAVGFVFLVIYRDIGEIWRNRPTEVAWIIFFAGLFLHTILMLCYFWGRWDDPVVRRLSLPCHVWWALAVVYIVPRLVEAKAGLRWATAGAALFLAGYTIPAVSAHRYTTIMSSGSVATWINRVIGSISSDERVMALDVQFASVWMINRVPALSSFVLRARPEQFLYHYKRKTWDRILAVQRFSSDLKGGGFWLNEEDDFGPAIKLEKVAERQFGNTTRVRISEVKDVDPEAFLAYVKMENNVPASVVITGTAASGVATEQPDRDKLFKEWVENLP